MASFTDIIPQFNPYVQQLPVDALVNVGMAKQKAYEENVTKIQSQMDAIAGLAIARPADRTYLQSKLNQLGSKLTTLAGADFSNFQLANSVSGMTKQIVKDGVVQTAVRATAHAQQQQQKIEDGKADGTWSVENEDLYNSQYQKWYNGKNPGEAFNSEYIPYRDVYKKLRGIAKDVGVDESLVQNLFNPDGSVNKVMVETYSKGKDPNKIYDAFVNGLDESDYRQLSITGRYKYKGYDNNQLSEVLTNSNNEYVSAVNARKLDLENRLREITKARLTTKKPEEIKELDQAESQIKSTILKLDEGIRTSTEQLQDVTKKLSSGDEDYANQIRARIHTNKFLTSLSRDFADKTSYVKYAENPLWKAMMDEEKLKWDIWYKKAHIDVEKRKAAAQEKANKLTEQQIIGEGTAGYIPGDKIATYENINSAYVNFSQERTTNYAVLARACFDGNTAKMEEYVNARVKQGKTRDEVIAELGVQEYTRIAGVINDPKKYGSATRIDRNLLTAVQNISVLNGRITGMKSLMETAESNAYSSAGMDPKVQAENQKRIDKLSRTLQVPIRENGRVKETRNIKVSGDDMLDISRVGQGEQMWGIFSNKSQRAEGVNARKRLETKYGKTVADAIIDQFAGDLNFNISIPVSEAKVDVNYAKFSEERDKQYAQMFSGFFPMNRGFILNEKNRPLVMGKLTATLTGRPEFDETTAKMLLENGSQVTLVSDPSVMGFGGTSNSVVITGKDGKTSAPIPISREVYSYLTGDQTPEVDIDLEMARARMNGSPDRSTNRNGLGTWETAYFSPFNFPNVRRHNILGADISQEMNNPNSYYLTLYMQAAGSRQPVPVPVQGSFSLTEAMAIPSLMNDAKLSQILK